MLLQILHELTIQPFYCKYCMNLQYSHFVTNTALTYDTAILLQILEGLINVHVLYYEAKQGYRGKSK